MTKTAARQADETLALELMSAIRDMAETTCAPDEVELVSVTMDVSARTDAPADAVFETRIDRRTRTILFAGGTASIGGIVVMSATVVYSIHPAAAG
ncbi:MAG TPA: hypothetical protein PLR76_04925 [Hyphomonas sp.]|nr:hypothetical protein [Hyphomonas sp.]MCA8905010.1 hypothetical protein [Hyphomonas sp.]MCB9962453.1 hypothetical protein [Hyphomonas sp.]MCB9972095.1 hypothetical protein [Hyphomonas sp.]HPE47714.1 hypothetical protein [Hyphomonas sp.]